MPKGDEQCPLGFAPHSIRPTRCKRCFRDYSQHKTTEATSKGKNDANNTKTPSTKSEAEGSSSSGTGTGGGGSKTTKEKKGIGVKPKSNTKDTDTSTVDSPKLRTDKNPIDKHSYSSTSNTITATTPTSATKEISSTAETATGAVRRRRPKSEDDKEPTTTTPSDSSQETNRRIRSRPGSWACSDSNGRDKGDDAGPKSERPQPDVGNRRVQILSARELRPSVIDETIAIPEASADVAFILRVKTSTAAHNKEDVGEDDDSISLAATETTLAYQDSVEDMQALVQGLSRQVEDWQQKYQKLETERKTLPSTEKDNHILETTATELLKLKSKVFELESENEELRDENHVFRLEVKELQEDVDKRPTKEEMDAKVTELQQKLHRAEMTCEELVEENEEMKKEMRDMEEEIDEMQDNFREEQVDEYRDLRKELEQTAKNCRILQFKLRKAERQCEQLESEKNAVDDKLKMLTNADDIDFNKSERLRKLESEVKASRQVSTHMHVEMEALKKKLSQVETERDALVRQGTGSPNGELLGRKTTDTIMIHPTISKGSYDSDDSTQLIRELYDTVEREKDLKEQLKFSEEEASSLRKKLTTLEEENESLVLQIKKMVSNRPTKGKRSGTTEADDSGVLESTDNEDLPSPLEMKLQLELLEHEGNVLRKKMTELEEENENLHLEIKSLEGRNQKTLDERARTMPEVEPDAYYEQRIQLLENEAKELRRKLIDKERENEQLQTEANSKLRRGSKASMQRSRSLDSDTQVDLRRQLQLVEQEAAILRQKTVDLEDNNDKLLAENKRLQLRIGSKRPQPGTDAEQLTVENSKLKETISVLEKKVSDYSVTGKDRNDTTAKEQEKEIGVLQKKIEELSKENEEFKKFKGSNYKQKTPKKIGENCTRPELKKYINELEEEIRQMGIALEEEKNLQNAAASSEESKNLKEQLEKQNSIHNQHEKEIQNLKATNSKLESQLTDEKNKLTKLDNDLSKVRKEKEATVAKMQKNKANEAEMNNLKKRAETLEKELSEEKKKHAEIRNKFDSGHLVDSDAMQKIEKEKQKLQKEVTEHQKRITDLEMKINDFESSSKESAKINKILKKDFEEAKKELEVERSKMKKVDTRQAEVAVGWLKERDELKNQLTDALKKQDQLQDEQTRLQEKLRELEEELAQNRENAKDTLQQKERELKASKEQFNKLKVRLDEAEDKLLGKGSIEDGEYLEKWKKTDAAYRKDKEEWLSRELDLESQLKTEQKRRNRMEKDYESELRDRDDDMHRLKDKVRKAENEIKKLSEQKGDDRDELMERIKILEKENSREKQNYEDLTVKYELLEEDYVVIKAQLVMEKEQVESNYNTLKRDHTEVEGELRTLRDTFNLRQDTWIKEKLDMQEKIKELSTKLSRSNSAAWDVEKARLKENIAEKTNLLEQMKKDEHIHKEELDKLRRQVEGMHKKLEDYERVKAYGRSASNDNNSEYIKEAQDLRNKLQQEERAHRTEMASTKMKNEQRVAQLQDDIHALHLQNAKFRRERDTFKEMMEGAQKTIGDLKSDTIPKEKSSQMSAELTELKKKVDQMRREKEVVLDKLDVSERNYSRARTEYVTEKASWEIKLAEQQAKINELEEATILQGGKSKIFGVKAKLELAWQKEREEQHRLLTESHRMAKDLKERLLDVEGARDKEQIEAKRQLEEVRTNANENQIATQKKIQELQDDLVQLRDAHSKMRAFNERVRRDKERAERERDELRAFISESQQLQYHDRLTVAKLIEEAQKIKLVAPSILGAASSSATSTKPVHVSPQAKLDDALGDEFRSSLKRILMAAEELNRAQGAKEEDRIRRNLSFRKAISEDEDYGGQSTAAAVARRRDDPLSRWQNPQRVTNYPTSPPSMYFSPQKRQSLYRKSLSLDQSFNGDNNANVPTSIWKASDGDTSGGSTTSLPFAASHRRQGSADSAVIPTPSPRLKKHLRKMKQQSSLESDVSGTSLSSRDASIERDHSTGFGSGSSSADVGKVSTKPATKKIGSGVKEKLKRLTKSKSVEVTPTGEQIRNAGFQGLTPGLGGGSSSSVSDAPSKEVKGKDLKSRIASLFKKTAGRRNSLDKESLDSDSKARTLSSKCEMSKAALATSPKYGSASALYPMVKKY